MADIKDKIFNIISNSIRNTGHHPFLFVGSGISKRYLNSEKWDELLKFFCTELNGNEFQYNVYASQLDENDYYGQQPAIASLLEKDYNHAVLTSPKYEIFRNKYRNELQNKVSALKIAVSNHLSKYTLPKESIEIELLKKLSIRSISGVITTNYDTMLDELFPKFTTYIGQEELIFANITGIGEIYKIHGSLTDPKSLVLTSKDYELFEEKSSYLIAKLLTIFLESPIIFIGYSLNDRNIRNIFQTISNCLSQKKLDILRDRLIFVDYSNNENISDLTIQCTNGNNIKMSCIATDSFSTLYEAILSVPSQYNPAILSTLRRDIYELASSSKPSRNIVACGFEHLDDINKAGHFVLGIGVAQNGHVIKAEQLYEDIIFDNKYFNPNLVIEEYLPELLKQNSGGLPMYKYLSQYNGEVFEKVKNNTLRYTTIDSFLNSQLRIQKNAYRQKHAHMSVQNIVKYEGFRLAYRRLIFLNKEEINLEELLNYLRKLIKDETPDCLKGNSELKRLIRIYDLLKYK